MQNAALSFLADTTHISTNELYQYIPTELWEHKYTILEIRELLDKMAEREAA